MVWPCERLLFRETETPPPSLQRLVSASVRVQASKTRQEDQPRSGGRRGPGRWWFPVFLSRLTEKQEKYQSGDSRRTPNCGMMRGHVNGELFGARQESPLVS